MVYMVSHEAFACRCAEGDVVLRQSYKPESYAQELNLKFLLLSKMILCMLSCLAMVGGRHAWTSWASSIFAEFLFYGLVLSLQGSFVHKKLYRATPPKYRIKLASPSKNGHVPDVS
ncbi:hypothetical protein Tco_1157021 [Tanacetum coccineum]